MNLAGIEKAAGLDASQRETMAQLKSVYTSLRPRNEMLRNYYEGDIVISDFGVEVDNAALKGDAVCYWPQKAVDVLAERIRFDGFVTKDDQPDAVLDAIMRRNRIVNAYRRYTPSKLTQGVMFGVVNNTGGVASVKFHSAETAAAIPDGNHDSGVIGAGFVIARMGRPPWGPKGVALDPVPLKVNAYLPGKVAEISRVGMQEWVAEVHDVPEPDPMMFAFVHKSSGSKPFGRSRISKAVRGYTRAAMRTMYHMEASGAFYAFPKLALMGLTDEQFDAMVTNKQKAYVDSMLMTTRDEDGNVPSAQQFSGNSPQPFIDELRCYAGFIAGATGVPLTSLGIVQDNPSSADAMTSAREDLCIMAERDADDDRDVLNRLILTALAVEGNTDVASLLSARPDYAELTAHFQSPFVYSKAAEADRSLKLASVAPWYANTDVFLEENSFDKPTIERMRRARDEYSTAAALDKVMASVLDAPIEPVEPMGE